MSSEADTDDALSFLRAGAVEQRLLGTLAGALNVSRLHDLDNVAVTEAVSTLATSLTGFLRTRDRAVFLVAEGRVYLNGRLVRAPRRSGHSFLDDFLGFMDRMGFGGIMFTGSWTTPTIRQLLGILRKVDKEIAQEQRVAAANRFVESLPSASVLAVLDAEGAAEFVKEEEEGYASARERAAYYFSRLIALIEVSHQSVAAGAGPDVSTRHLRQTVMGIVDHLGDSTFVLRLLGLTALPPLNDAPLASHCANVAVLSGCMGHLLGLKRAGLADLFYAAIHHDVGRVGQPMQLGEDGAEEPLSAEMHIVRGLRSCLRGRNYGNMGLLRMVVVQEHHRVADGYPESLGLRDPHLFSQIVAVADAFDRLQNGKGGVAGVEPKQALDAVVGDSRFNSEARALLRDVLGTYPRGTTLRLWDGGIGVVVSGGARRNHTPLVRRLLSADQMPDDARPLIELTNAASNATLAAASEFFIDWRTTVLE